METFASGSPENAMTVSDRPTYLEGLRGVAALMVVFGHTLNAFYPP